VAADITTLTVIGNHTTNLQVTSSDITVVNTVTDITVLNTTSATITVPSSINLSNIAPSDISDVAEAGVSTMASRSDHKHSAANAVLNGGNF
jgi:hypothetical protein